MRSRYLDRFQAVQNHDSLEMIGDLLVVEKLKEPEKKVGSLYVPEIKHVRSSMGADTQPCFLIVVAVGKGYYDDATKTEIPLNVKPGDIIMVGNASVKYFSTFGDLQDYEPDSLGITRESEIQMRFRGEDGYSAIFDILNSYGRKNQTPV